NERLREGRVKLKDQHKAEQKDIVNAGTQADAVSNGQKPVIEGLERRLADARVRLKELEEAKGRNVEDATKRAAATAERIRKGEEHVATLKDVDTSGIENEIENIEHVNRRVRENKAYAELSAKVLDLEKKAHELTSKIEAMDEAKRDAIAAAKMPVPGLSFDEENGVMLN